MWSKNEEINDKNKNTSIQTTYTRSTNSYIKEYQINADKLREQYSFKYNGDDELIIAYSSTDYANNRCLIIEEATYNRKNKNFTCKTKFNSNNCPLKCNKLKKLGADFSKELDKMFKKGNINEQFLVKNRD